MKIQGKDYRTVWMEGNEIKLIEQRLLPHKFEIFHGKPALITIRSLLPEWLATGEK